MLEIKNLTKVYKTKGGADVKALDNVSIKFEDTGLVFLLGKSGSGKSTLLNLAGGLDAPTEGEVIVMGKSSKEFSKSDFDSYRNTFIGFVFQEYNVLNEFNVAENVALALELQGKTKGQEKVRQILEEVDLAGFAKRKPNTLSGGQKQRIAIARALVKDPQIIMADEPTGALDSATGRQVFDTLKKLSQTRLVLVVSHDREFAEIYGDRIVELKDGKIISDVIKIKEAASISGRVKQIGLDTLSVQAGAADEETMQKIRAFLLESNGEVVISRGEKEIENFRRANRIDEKGAREHFANTEEKYLKLKQYDGKQIKFIRSRLPMGKALKIGASGLKLKPFRLLLTIFLSCVAFIMFGLFSTLTFYDGEAVLKESFMNSDYTYLSVRKGYTIHGHSDYQGDFEYTNYAKFTPAEVTKFGSSAIGIYSIDQTNVNNLSCDSRYYFNGIQKVTVLPEGHPLRNTLSGKYPEGADEIAVSSFFLESAKNGSFFSVNSEGFAEDKLTITGTKENTNLFGQKITFLQQPLSVTGIFDSGSIPSKYESLKEPGRDYMAEARYAAYLEESNHTLAFVSEAFVKEHESILINGNTYVEYFDYCENNYCIKFRTDYGMYFSGVKVYDPTSSFQLPVIKFKEFSSLKEDEIIVSLSVVYTPLMNDLSERSQQEEQAMREANPYIDPQREENETDEEYFRRAEEFRQKYEKEMTEATEAIWEPYVTLGNAFMIILNNQWNDPETGEYRRPTKAEKQEATTRVEQFFQETIESPLSCELEKDESKYGNYNIVGVYMPPENGNNGVYCSQSFYDAAGVYKDRNEENTKYQAESDAVFGSVLVPFSHKESEYNTLIQMLDVNDPETDIIYSFNNTIASNVDLANNMIEELSTIFLWVGVVMALFSALLLLNFITISISNKKKEIGILRAVGARGLDVFKIFFSESGIIVGICTILSIIGATVLSAVLNNIIKKDIGLEVALFVFGLPSVAVMIGVALLVALFGTYLPVFSASRKKPVESIRAL